MNKRKLKMINTVCIAYPFTFSLSKHKFSKVDNLIYSEKATKFWEISTAHCRFD